MTAYWTRKDVAGVMRRMWPTHSCAEIRAVLQQIPAKASLSDGSLRDGARRLGVRKKRDPNGIEAIIRRVYPTFGAPGVQAEIKRRALPPMTDGAVHTRAHIIGVRAPRVHRSRPQAAKYEPTPEEIAEMCEQIRAERPALKSKRRLNGYDDNEHWEVPVCTMHVGGKTVGA